MSRKRICEDCGNKCNDEYCPICGRKTKRSSGTDAFLEGYCRLYMAAAFRNPEHRSHAALAGIPGTGNVYKSIRFLHLPVEVFSEVCYYCTI